MRKAPALAQETRRLFSRGDFFVAARHSGIRACIVRDTDSNGSGLERLLMLIPPKIRVNHHVTQLLETRPRLPA